MSIILPDSKSIRKFTLFIGFVLLGITIAGIKICENEAITILGISIKITRPNLLPLVIAIISIYSTIRFIYYEMVIRPSPLRAKRRLIRGSRVDTSTNPKNLEELYNQVTEEVHRYFPRVPNRKVKIEAHSSQSQMWTKLEVPKSVLILSRVEDFDFLLPVLINVVALILWVVLIVV